MDLLSQRLWPLSKGAGAVVPGLAVGRVRGLRTVLCLADSIPREYRPRQPPQRAPNDSLRWHARHQGLEAEGPLRRIPDDGFALQFRGARSPSLAAGVCHVPLLICKGDTCADRAAPRDRTRAGPGVGGEQSWPDCAPLGAVLWRCTASVSGAAVAVPRPPGPPAGGPGGWGEVGGRSPERHNRGRGHGGVGVERCAARTSFEACQPSVPYRRAHRGSLLPRRSP